MRLGLGLGIVNWGGRAGEGRTCQAGAQSQRRGSSARRRVMSHQPTMTPLGLGIFGLGRDRGRAGEGRATRKESRRPVGHLFSNVVDQEQGKQLLIITNLRLPKHYLHIGIILIRRRSRRTYLHHFICE
jgi:hypothetical protein